MKDVADDLALIVRNAIAYIKELERQVNELKRAAEPVAWSFEARHIDSAWAAAVTLKHPGPEGKYMRKVTPLYTAPIQRKPLTEEEALDIARTFGAQPWPPGSCVAFARAIEANHGITS